MRHSYQFRNVPNPKWHRWKVDNDDSFVFEWTSGKIVPQELVAMILLVARRRMIMP